MHPNTVKELISIAYVKLIASYCDSELIVLKQDIGGIDCFISHPGSVTGGGLRINPQIQFQVKSTQDWKITDGYVVYELKKGNYNWLTEDSCVPAALAVFLLPKDNQLWHHCTPEQMVFRHSAYWINFKGEQIVENKSTITIRIPLKNHLSPITLKIMLINLSHGRDFDHGL